MSSNNKTSKPWYKSLGALSGIVAAVLAAAEVILPIVGVPFTVPSQVYIALGGGAAYGIRRAKVPIA